MRVITIYAPIRGFGVFRAGGRIVERRNRLLHNFFRMLYGILSYQNVTVYDSGGNAYTWNLQNDPMTRGPWGGCPHADRCAETEELPFSANICSRNCRDDGYEDDVGLAELTDRVCAQLTLPAGCNANSTTIAVAISTTEGTVAGVRLAHSVATIVAGDIVAHRICFYEPWLRNFAAIWAAIFCDCDRFSAVDMNGTQFDIRGSGDVFEGSAKMVIGYGTDPFTFVDHSLTNPKEVATTISADITDTYANIVITGQYTPPTDEVIYEIGMKLPIYDINGTLHDVLVLRHVNPSGYSVSAGQPVVIRIIIHGE